MDDARGATRAGRTAPATRPLGSAIPIGSGTAADASVTTWTGRKRGASVNDDGERREGRSARSFQRHQYSCFGMYPSRRGEAQAYGLVHRVIARALGV